MAVIYLYTSPEKLPKAAIMDIGSLEERVSKREKPSLASAITVITQEGRLPLIRFDVSDLDYETKHEIDIEIRKLLKRHKVKFTFSNAGLIKQNFYHDQKRDKSGRTAKELIQVQ